MLACNCCEWFGDRSELDDDTETWDICDHTETRNIKVCPNCGSDSISDYVEVEDNE